MSSRILRVILGAGIVWFASVGVGAGGVVILIPEVEPNNTAATANALPMADQCARASGSITANDVDYYSFTAPPGARLWALVDTSPSTAGNRDSLLTLIGPDGTTVIASDDDDGNGTDCDGIQNTTLDNTLSSALAGEVLSAGGTYFLRVEAAFAGDAITSYKLSLVVTTSSSAEVESNNTAATANTIVTGGSLIGVRDAAIGAVGDVDFYSVAAPAGSTLLISADAGSTDVAVDLIASDGTTVLVHVDTSATGAAQAESFCWNVGAPATLYVRVSASTLKGVTGPYSLMVAACGVPVTPTPTPTVTLTGVVGGPSPTPTVTQTGVVGGPSPTPTLTRTATATATVTSTRTFTPIGGGPAPLGIPTLSFPMLGFLAIGLVSAAFLILRRL
jgi:pre-peptidase